ncbi:MAG: TasA family protein [Candidatus Pacebacteria bacterium]|nr:TasA family protein [Candidatus Paceibacterota bacterium]
MNKKILLSLSVIAAVATIAVGGTIAYFNDVETSTGNTITAGTIDLSVNGQNGGTISPIITEGDIKPGETKESVVVNLTNSGNNDGLADLHVTSAVHSEGATSEPECLAENSGDENAWNGTSCVGTGDAGENICSKITLTYTYDANGNGVKDAGESGTLGTLASKGSLNLDVLPTGVDRKVWIDYTLDSNATNKFQGDICTFAVDFTLKQLGIP